MNAIDTCPECGADWTINNMCEACFHEALYWEWQHQLFEVHHLLVLCYHLQHPSLYSPQFLNGAKEMLMQFVEHGVSPQEMRKQIQYVVYSGQRDFKIKGTQDVYGTYDRPVEWEMRIADVVSAGIEHYYASTKRWAESILTTLRESGNLHIQGKSSIL